MQEEKLEPLKNINDDPRIRLLNRLYAKKRKELQERQKLKVILIYFTCFACFDMLCNDVYLFHLVVLLMFEFYMLCWVCFRIFRYSKSKRMSDLWTSYFVL